MDTIIQQASRVCPPNFQNKEPSRNRLSCLALCFFVFIDQGADNLPLWLRIPLTSGNFASGFLLFFPPPARPKSADHFPKAALAPKDRGGFSMCGATLLVAATGRAAHDRRKEEHPVPQGLQNPAAAYTAETQLNHLKNNPSAPTPPNQERREESGKPRQL